MKIIPAIIAIFFGCAFLWVELGHNYFPPIPTVVVTKLFETPEQAKARAAVMSMLLYPDAAGIDEMKTVKSGEGSRYVCGKVNGKNRSGAYVGPHNFVYEVAGNVAAIEEDDQIVRSHRSFYSCPEDDTGKPLVVDLDKLNKVAMALPKPDVRIAVPAGSGLLRGSASSGSAGNQDLRQGLEGLQQNVERRIGGSSGSAGTGSPSASRSNTSTDSDRQWRDDRPPKEWPKFSADDPLSISGDDEINTRTHTDSEAIDYASDVERRWNSANRPSVSEILKAQRALLTIKEQSPQYPRAWASFVRLQNIRRNAA